MTLRHDDLKLAPEPLALVQEFVNTRSLLREFDLLDTPERARDWLAEHQLIQAGAEVEEADHRRVVQTRENLRALLLAHNGYSVSGEDQLLDELARSAHLKVRFKPDTQTHLEPASSGVDGAIGWLVAGVVQAATNGTWPRLKACRENSCRWAFYDRSKNRSSTWCTMDVCGARAKMRAYRQRQANSENV